MNNNSNSCKLKKIEDQLRILFSTHSSTVPHHLLYISYGILVSIFYYGNDFTQKTPALSITTFIFTLASISLMFFYQIYLSQRCEYIIDKYLNEFNKHNCDGSDYCEKGSNEIYLQYKNLRNKSSFIFNLFTFSSFISIVLFIFLSLNYFYGINFICY